MRKSKFSEVQIAAILKEAEVGAAVAEVARKARHQRSDVLSMAVEVRRNGSVGY